MQHGGLDVVDVDGVFDHMEPHFIGRAVGDPALDAASGHPHGERLRMVVTAFAAAEGGIVLDHRGPTEFPAPHNECLIEQAPLLQIPNQRRTGPVGRFTTPAHIAGHVTMRIPSFMVNIDESHASLDHPTCEQTGPRK